MDALKEAIRNVFFEGKVFASEEIHITNIRHWNLLKEAKEVLCWYRTALKRECRKTFIPLI